MSFRSLFLLCSLSWLALAACSTETPAEPEDAAKAGPDARAPGADASTVEDTLEACQDQEDNDGDGYTDCADQDCWIFVACARPDASAAGPDAGGAVGADAGGAARDAGAGVDAALAGEDSGIAQADGGFGTNSANRFGFWCTPSSLPGFSQFGSEIQCRVSAADVSGNFVPGQVLFLKEAGGVPRSASLVSVPMEGGAANLTYRAECPYPRDVASSGSSDPGAACKFQNNCLAVPAEESRTCNPRDTWATLVAVITDGSEAFQDLNGNRTWDPGENYTDLAEPFVDADDDKTRDDDEDFFDANNNGKWDARNGKWDSSTAIWTTAKVVWTGAPY